MDLSLQPAQKIEIVKPVTPEEEIAELKLKIDSMSKMFFMLRKLGNDKKKKEATQKEAKPVVNKDGIPMNTCFTGYTRKSPHPYILIVNDKGEYIIGEREFDSLSSAAEFVSGVRRSGWTFWKTLEGLSAKELYKQD